MLVCNVIQSRRRAAIAADIAEAAAALDAPGTGNVVFATLVDDPASVGEHVDAFLGQIMREAASATATVNAGFAYAVAIAEAAAAADASSSVVSGVAFPTWEAASVTAVTLSGGNLVATNTGTTSTDQGAKVASASGKNSGKYYFESTWTARTGGANHGVGIGTYASTYIGMGNTGGVTGVIAYFLGSVWANGGSVLSGGAWTAGRVMGIAANLDNRKIWFRDLTTGLWNNNASYDPATNVGGLTIPAGVMVPFATFGGGGGLANNVVTANFGAAAFTGAVPSGFTSGWPA